MRISSNHQTSWRRWKQGLSLVEMLTTICVLGLLTSIVVPQMSALSKGEAAETKNRRNAQSLASVWATADAAGLNFVVEDNLEQTIRNIIKGGSLDSGPFRGKVFAVKGMDEEDIQAVQKYLTLNSGMLSYSRQARVTQ